MPSLLRPAATFLLLLTVITGVIYPAVVTGIGRLLFPTQAGGSVIERHGTAIGSELIAQPFTDPKYFWPRPSAVAYDGASSGASNLSPTNPALINAVHQRMDALKAADPTNDAPVPVDLVTASASGMDPHISIAAARYQIGRVARARNLPDKDVENLVSRFTEDRTFGVLGEPRVNVLKLNLALDRR